MIDESVMVFSGGMTSPFGLRIITKVSPEGTALTIPLSHPVDWLVDAIASQPGSARQKDRHSEYPKDFFVRYKQYIHQ